MNLITLQNNIKKLENTITNYSRSGGGAGSILLIEADTNISLWIWCYWEIKKSGVILANADDDTTAVVGKIAVAAKQLEGKRIIKTEMDISCYHLHITFEEDYELLVFCESQPPEEPYPLNNWELSIKNLNITYLVTCNFTIKQDIFITHEK